MEDPAERFYAWELRGRGWQVWPRPVALEPPFKPFPGYAPARGRAFVDDGRRPTWISAGIASVAQFLGVSRAAPASAADIEEEDDPEPTPGEMAADLPRTEFRVLLPPRFDPPRAAAEQLIQTLGASALPVSFELVGTADSVDLVFSAASVEFKYVREHLAAFVPEAALIEEDGFLDGRLCSFLPLLVVEFGLAAEFLLPLRALREFALDPLTPLVSVLSGLQDREVALLQVLFQEAVRPWEESIQRALTGPDGRAVFADAPELLAGGKRKAASPLLACVIRVGVQAETDEDALVIVSRIAAVFNQFAAPGGNTLIPLANDGYPDGFHRKDLLNRATRRSGMLLAADEIAALVHLPGASIRHPKFARLDKSTKAAPAAVLGHALVLGQNEHHGRVARVTISPEQRMRHTYLVGASGTGKSTLLLSMILQDVESGAGVAVLDPHGDLVDQVLARIPDARAADVVLFDPADEEYPVGFNILAAYTELERTLLSSDLVAVFRRLSTSWGDQLNAVLANAILAFLESSQGGSLLELRRFLVDAEFRKSFLQTVQDPDILFYWQREFPLLRGNPQAPILTRLDVFLRPKLVRNIVGQTKSSIDFRDMMDSGKIFLGKLAQGAIGEENSYLLGAFLVSKFHQTALSRQEQEVSSRRDFFLFADEFHHFATPSMASLLSGVRKYRLGLTLAHQSLGQLGGKSGEIAGAVLGNAYTRVVFRVGEGDARDLAQGFADFEARDLQNLGVGEAVARVERAEFDFNLTCAELPVIDPAAARERREQVRDLSRARYATPRPAAQEPLVSIEPAQESPAAEPAVPSPPPTPVQVAAQIPREVAPQPAKPTPTPTRTPGRGGQKHKYLQSLIKQIGEDRGFRATVEKSVLDGSGSIDVALEREGCSVACEISVTTPTEYEVGNLAKCLEAGFEYAVLVSANQKALSRAREAAEKMLSDHDRERVVFLAPEAVGAFLDQLPGPERVETVGGYRVKVAYKPAQPQEKSSRLRAVRDVIARSLRGLDPPK